ncbi:hypothetical protein ACHAW6_004719 [Cyclotella cf. meneghiniana]
MYDPMTHNGFEHVLNAININIVSYLAPKDLFHLSCANTKCEKVVGEHLFEACRLQLETPVEQWDPRPSYEQRWNRCSARLSRARSFLTKEELLDDICNEWLSNDLLISHLRLKYEQPDLTSDEALEKLKAEYGITFFDLDEPHLSVDDGENVLLRTDCAFIANLKSDSSYVSLDGRPWHLRLQSDSHEKEFIKDWTNYLLASKNVTADCWRWEIRQQYTFSDWWIRCTRHSFGFSCVFSEREGGEEIELFADIVY